MARCRRIRTSSACRRTATPTRRLTYGVGNGGPTLDQRAVIDAGFLELVRLGELPADDPDVVRSLGIVDATIKTVTPSGPGWHRYNGDGYGDRASDGRPWAPSGQGTGHLWPVLSAERAEHALMSGDIDTAASLLAGMNDFASGVGLIPEQDWETADIPASPYGTDPTVASIGFQNGKAAGSASPLTWSAASFVRLTADLAAKRNVVLPQVTFQRYVAHTQGTTTLTVTSPADNSRGDRFARDGHGHDRGRQYGLRLGDEHRCELGDDRGLGTGRRRRLVQHRRRRSPAGPASSTSWPSARPAARRTSSARSCSISCRGP